MAISVTIEGSYYIPKGPSIRLGYITLDNSYPNSGNNKGWAVSAADLKLNTIQKMILQGSVDGYEIFFDHSSSRIRAFYPRAAITGTLAIADHTVTQGTVTVTSATGDGDAGTFNTVGVAVDAHVITGVAGVAKGAGEEVENGHSSLNSKVIHFIAFGY